jgi:probable H4MPT-linked C1 transfer pathway protein
MATASVLGLDIGGANLKAATSDKRAVSVPFALWKQPDRLPAALAELVARFPDAEELAVTMTGELCDCYETKRDGVNAIIAAARFASGGRRIRVWSTDGEFLDSEQAKANHLKVASANWHALATYAGRFAPRYGGFLLDIGSTTSDLIPLRDGKPAAVGLTDFHRLMAQELVYLGVGRTPVCAVMPQEKVAAELFATTRDVYIAMGKLPEDAADTDTADGRPATRRNSLARLARMLCGDLEMLSEEQVLTFAGEVHSRITDALDSNLGAAYAANDSLPPVLEAVILSGTGEFLAREVIPRLTSPYPRCRVISLNEELGPVVSACAPAYAVAVLAAERR